LNEPIVQLDTKVIVREESDCYLFYNSGNRGLISLSKITYNKCFIQNRWDNSDIKFKKWLFENSFLVKKPNKLVSDQPPLENEAFQDCSSFFDLKSEYSPLNVLWALSPKCNLNCTYCFPDAKAHIHSLGNPSTERLLKISNKLIEGKVLKVTLTGGECLLLNNLWVVVKQLKNAGITIAILSNGTTMSNKMLRKIKDTEVFMGISLDGSHEEVNRLTRGSFAFEKTMKSIAKLIDNKVPTTVMVTVTRNNFSDLYRIIELVSTLGVSSVTLQDLRPFGTRETYDKLRLSPNQEKDLEKTLERIAKSFPNVFLNTSELMIFHKTKTNGLIMQCPAGDNFAYIDFYGDFFPCTSLPSFKLGNLLGDCSIPELWQNSKAIQLLRSIKNMPIDKISACNSCINKSSCDGGCRGDALFYNNDLFGMASRCPKELDILR
jgi:radical SAM protein with 4Fe4S-binding SPASM domain